MVFGASVFLLFFALDTYQSRIHNFQWFFDLDLNYALYKRICSLLNIPNPLFYAMQEQERRQSLIESTHPPIRGYDLLVTLCTAVVGMSKSVLAYREMGMAVTSIDWVGVVVVVGFALYWLGLYEFNTIGLMPYLFTTDYSSDIKENITITTPILILPYLPLVALASWWTYKCTTWVIFLSHVFDWHWGRDLLCWCGFAFEV
ncbi:hypothetical protein BDQ17DRAFT_1422465 [Cyathus striatus]|nr:hypothetical protein BDQ17DRAFT_1422465 [Cyathus striatus]